MTIRTALALTGLLVGLNSARATTMQAETLEQLVQKSELIVVGDARAIHSYWDEGRIKTDVTLDVLETWLSRDAATQETVTFTTLGGFVGDIGQRVDGATRAEAGDRLVLFLERDTDGHLRSVSLSQGAFSVVKGPAKLSNKAAIKHQALGTHLIVPPGQRQIDMATVGALKSAVLEIAQ